MTNLPRPDFLPRDPEAQTNDLVAQYEGLVQKTLFPAQPERLLINVLAYADNLLRLLIQDGLEQNLVNYARGVNLDQLGALVGAPRLAATFAQATVQFTKTSAAIPNAVTIPEGTRVSAGVGLLFATTAGITINANDETGSVTVVALEAGDRANALPVGSIQSIVDPVLGIASVESTTVTSGGSPTESDDRYRERIKIAPATFSVAGSTDAYRFFALSVDQSIIDVSVTSPAPVKVNIYPLTESGAPSAELKAAVAAAVSGERVRPLTDIVEVLDPSEVEVNLEATVIPKSGADPGTLALQLNAAAVAYADLHRRSLGMDVILSQLISMLHLDTVYQVIILAPTTDILVSASQWANIATIDITVAPSPTA